MRALPDNNLAYPVLIRLENGGTGSGFYLNTKQSVVLVTAKHVLLNEEGKLHSPNAELRSYSGDPNEKTPFLFNVDLKLQQANDRLRANPQYDVVVVRVLAVEKDGSPRTLSSVQGVVGTSAPTNKIIIGVNMESTKSFDEVLVGNNVIIFGYPTSLGIKEMAQIDEKSPLLRSGLIAGKSDPTKAIVLDCPVYPGNSGGPVLEIEEVGLGQRTFRVIGVVSQFVPLVETWINEPFRYSNVSVSNSGYCIATAMNPVLDLTGTW